MHTQVQIGSLQHFNSTLCPLVALSLHFSSLFLYLAIVPTHCSSTAPLFTLHHSRRSDDLRTLPQHDPHLYLILDLPFHPQHVDRPFRPFHRRSTSRWIRTTAVTGGNLYIGKFDGSGPVSISGVLALEGGNGRFKCGGGCGVS